MKRVLILSMAYFPHVGGAEVAVREITNRIPPGDLEFHLITLRFSRDEARCERIGNVLVYRVGSGSSRIAKFLFQFRAAIAATRLHRQEGFSLVWAIMAHSAGVPAALFNLRYPNVPLLLTLQEGDPPEEVERTMRPLWPLFSRAFTHATAVQAISTFLGEWARRRGFRGPLEIVGNGVDLTLFARSVLPHERDALRQKLGKKPGEIWLIHTGRLVHKNALDSVIQALPLLPAAVHFFAIGDGPEHAALEHLARDLHVAERLHLHPYVPLEELPAYLAACDIFIRPSRSEGMGNSFIEAMAAGLPVIATQEGGIADFLFDKERNPNSPPTGFAVSKEAPAEIAQKVEYILAHPQEAQEAIENAQRRVRERYDWDMIAGKMQALFLRICAS